MTKKQLQKEWFKEWRSKNMGMMIIRSISAGLLVISSYFITCCITFAFSCSSNDDEYTVERISQKK